jgi:hypothetical protein
MLVSVKKAYEKKCFEAKRCPIKMSTIDTYIQILKPAYEFSQLCQHSGSSIADVIPNLARMMYIWSKMNVSSSYTNLCKQLITSFKKKFNFELTSEIYQVKIFLLFI